MKQNHDTKRRTVLKTLGAGLAGKAVLPVSASARGNVVSQINSSGHWAWFPLGQEHWGRQKHPYDSRLGDSRWMAEPAGGGEVRALAKNITTAETPPNRNAGFDIHMGPLGELDSITFTSRTVQTQGDEALLFVGLYLDTGNNGEFFQWEEEQGDRESFLGTGDDDEGTLLPEAEGQFTIDDSTTFTLVTRGSPPNFPTATFGELKNGDKDDIDGDTHSALYLGVVDRSAETSGPEEAIIERVNIQKA